MTTRTFLLCLALLSLLFWIGAAAPAARNATGQDRNAALIEAARSGDLPAVKRLLAQGANVNGGIRMTGRIQPNAHESTPLAAAMQGNHTDVALYLLQRGASVKTGHYEGYPFYVGISRTPLIHAAEHGNLALVRSLLARGAKVNDLSKMGSALSFAAQDGHLAVARTLVAWGADVNEEDLYETPLQRAAGAGHADIVALLLRHGAEVNVVKKWDQTPLTAAASKGNARIVALLLDFGANINYCSIVSGKPTSFACQRHDEQILRNVACADDNRWPDLRARQVRKGITHQHDLRRRVARHTAHPPRYPTQHPMM